MSLSLVIVTDVPSLWLGCRSCGCERQCSETCTTSSTTWVRYVRNGPDQPSSEGRTHSPVVTSKMEPCSGQRNSTLRVNGNPPSGVAWCGHMLSNAHHAPPALAR